MSARREYSSLIMKQNIALVTFCGVLAALLQFFVIWIFDSMDYAPLLEVIIDQLPPPLRALAAEEFLTKLSVRGAAAFGLKHPLVVILMGLVAILVPSRHVAGAIEDGSMSFLLSYPIRRAHAYLCVWFSCALMLLLITMSALFGLGFAVDIFHETGAEMFGDLVIVAVNLWLLFAAIMSFSMFVSVCSNEGVASGGLSAAVIMVLYFMHFVSTMWNEASVVRPFNIFSYYNPGNIMMNVPGFDTDLILLGASVVVFSVLGVVRFSTRDIPA